MRSLVPNAVTALALCFGLSGVRFAISAASTGESGDWEKAVVAILIAAVLDGMDGRIARMLNGQSRFGAELDSLSDVIAFGVSPAIIIYLWSLQHTADWRNLGWMFALAYAVCCALRLARFNASIDSEDQPHKSAGYLTGVPAPAGAGLLFLPLYLWISTGEEIFREVALVAPWTALIAFLMISSVATFSWTALRLRRHIRLGAILVIGLIGAALFTAPMITLAVATSLYVLSIPFSIASYAKVRKPRAVPSPHVSPAPVDASLP